MLKGTPATDNCCVCAGEAAAAALASALKSLETEDAAEAAYLRASDGRRAPVSPSASVTGGPTLTFVVGGADSCEFRAPIPDICLTECEKT